jgi:hypothetical protein
LLAIRPPKAEFSSRNDDTTGVANGEPFGHHGGRLTGLDFESLGGFFAVGLDQPAAFAIAPVAAMGRIDENGDVVFLGPANEEL